MFGPIQTLLAAFLMFLGAYNFVAAAEPVKVMVMIEPQRYFVEQIGADHVSVTVLVPPGGDPHTYEPKPQTLVQVSQARLYFAMGIPEEQVWLPRLVAIRPDLRVVRQDEGIAKVAMETRAEIHGEHGSAAEHPNHDHRHHSIDALDPHIWLSPRLVRIQADTIARALCSLDPANADDYRTHLKVFQQRIDALDQRLVKVFASLQQHRGFLVVHPSWGYFARDYALQQIPMEIEGKEPTAADLAKLIQRTNTAGINVILVEPQFSQRFADMMARQTGIRPMVADPLAADWENNLWELGRHLAAHLSPQP
jgi:zinc transport system substrate-binding protein